MTSMIDSVILFILIASSVVGGIVLFITFAIFLYFVFHPERLGALFRNPNPKHLSVRHKALHFVIAAAIPLVAAGWVLLAR